MTAARSALVARRLSYVTIFPYSHLFKELEHRRINGEHFTEDSVREELDFCVRMGQSWPCLTLDKLR